jgi:hypothetical protein
MKKVLVISTLAMLMLLIASALVAGPVKGNAEEYHQALSLCYQHTADHAKALFTQSSNGALNMDLARSFLSQISDDLDHARVYHAMVHKSYSESDTKLIADDHVIILTGQSAAVTAVASLNAEFEKSTPDFNTVKKLSAVVFDGANKALKAHLDAMKKLGIPEAQAPAL